MLKFSVKQQTFYDTSLTYSYDLPTDLISVPEERHNELVSLINQGRRLDINLNPSDPKPNPYCDWVTGVGWVDNRSDDQKIIDQINSLHSLTQKQFRLMLLKINITPARVEKVISNLSNKSDEFLIVFNYSSDFDVNSDFIGTVLPLLGIDRTKLITIWKDALTL